MKTKLGMMVTCAALAVAAETGNAQNVVWVSSGSGSYASFSVGVPCAPARVVRYVPVVVTEPVCAWGAGTRTVMVPAYRERAFCHPAPPVYHRPPAVACRPAPVHSYSHHRSRGDSHFRGHRR
jgi:hypothetical protein